LGPPVALEHASLEGVLHHRDPTTLRGLITAYGSIEMARAAFKNGALDYITKPGPTTNYGASGQGSGIAAVRDENVNSSAP